MGEPQTLLVNGNQFSKLTTSEKSVCRYDVIDVQPSKTYLFRFIGAQALTYLRYALAEHQFTLVQVDGASYLKPLNVDHLEIAGGQRYAALLRTKSAAEIAGLGRTVFWANISSFFREETLSGYALVRYNLYNNSALPREAFQSVNESSLCIPKIADSEVGWIDGQLEPLIP